MKIEELKPNIVWKYFADICSIPRASGKEQKVVEYLLAFAKEHNLEAKQDEVGNVVICKKATEGRESAVSIALQSHTDMVCEKNSDVKHNFDTDPIIPYIDGDWVKATGTTLGADDGIGVALSLAILASEDIKHGEIECLFTVDEETGLKGAQNLKPNFIKSKMLINLDSEEEGEIYIGCAGGIDTTAKLKYSKINVPSNYISFKIKCFGLNGGHSGGDIHLGFGNANKILNRLIWNLNNKFDILLNSLNIGDKRNAIAREGEAIISILPQNEKEIIDFIDKYKNIIRKEFAIKEQNLDINIQKIEKQNFAIDKITAKNLLNALYSVQHGVIAMSKEIDNLVETSTNLAAVKTFEKEIVITTSQRSATDTAKINIANSVECAFLLAGCEIEHSTGYPGWKPNTNSILLKTAKNVYVDLFGEEPKILAIHAGLECGLFLEKYPFLDMISIGPTVHKVHSPDEMLNIKSTENFWILIKNILEKV